MLFEVVVAALIVQVLRQKGLVVDGLIDPINYWLDDVFLFGVVDVVVVLLMLLLYLTVTNLHCTTIMHFK